jgi:hypothetical protein
MDFSGAGALGGLAVFLSRVLSERHWFFDPRLAAVRALGRGARAVPASPKPTLLSRAASFVGGVDHDRHGRGFGQLVLHAQAFHFQIGC